MLKENDDIEPLLQPDLQPAAESRPLSLRGAEPGRGADGRFQVGNTAALVVGGRSAAFWRAQAADRRALEAELIADAGFTMDDAPAALKLAVEGLAQATLIQRSAFERIGEAGGPLTIRGRGRRAFLVWLQAFDRVEQGLRLVGLKRKSKPVTALAEVMNGGE